MVTLIFLWGVSEYIWINILTYDPGGVMVVESLNVIVKVCGVSALLPSFKDSL